MTTYIEYTLDDGSKFLIEAEEPMGGIVRASRRDGVDVIETSKKFKEALGGVRGAWLALFEELDALKVEEAEVKFGLKVVGEAGLIAVGRVGGEINYEVTLKWKNPENGKDE